MIITDTLQSISQHIPGETAQLDAQLLLAHILKKTRTWIVAHPETHLTEPQLASVQEYTSRLQAGEPLPYILGHREFYGLDFELTPDGLSNGSRLPLTAAPSQTLAQAPAVLRSQSQEPSRMPS
jgi:release factor glutamine methyltransferase